MSNVPRLAAILSLLSLVLLTASCTATAQAGPSAMPQAGEALNAVSYADPAATPGPARDPSAALSNKGPVQADATVQYSCSEKRTTRRILFPDGSGLAPVSEIVAREFRSYEVKTIGEATAASAPAPEQTPGGTGSGQGINTPGQGQTPKAPQAGQEMQSPVPPPPMPTTPPPAPNTPQPPAKPAVSNPGCTSAALATPTGGGTVLGGGCRTVWKKCSGCGQYVPLTSQVGQRCPHCGGYWSFVQNVYMD